MLTIIFNRLPEKFLMSKTQVSSYEKVNVVEFVPDNLYLVSLYVKSLYTRIPNADGLKAVKKSLDTNPKQAVATRLIKTFLALILTLSNFIFNSRNYLQTKGCAMGIICAPSDANLFMDHLELKLIYPFIKGFSLIYLRFIDDIFLYGLARRNI